MYRHGFIDTNVFNAYLEEFLEEFTDKGIRLTLLGDFNINLLDAQDSIVRDYKNVLNSVGFSPLINKPTRIFRAEGCNEGSIHFIAPTWLTMGSSKLLIFTYMM